MHEDDLPVQHNKDELESRFQQTTGWLIYVFVIFFNVLLGWTFFIAALDMMPTKKIVAAKLDVFVIRSGMKLLEILTENPQNLTQDELHYQENAVRNATIEGYSNLQQLEDVERKVCYLLLLSVVYSAACCRARLIYLAFTKNFVCSSRREYAKMVPLHIFIWLISMSGFFYQYFYPGNLPYTWVAIAPLSISRIFFNTWILYYSYHCRQASSRFSDLFVNVRYVIYSSLLYLTTLIVTLVMPDSLLPTIFLIFSLQSIPMIYIMDQFLSLTGYYYIREIQSRRSHQSREHRDGPGNSSKKLTCPIKSIEPQRHFDPYNAYDIQAIEIGQQSLENVYDPDIKYEITT
eukprot:Awhi_evm1s2239